MDSPEETVARMTEAQKAFILALPQDGGWRRSSGLLRNITNELRGFGKSGLIDGKYENVMRHRLTPQGRAVRALLEKKP